MVRYYATVGENEYEVEVADDGVLVNGRPIAVDLRQVGGPELYSLLFDGRSYELLIAADRYNYGVTLRGEHFTVQVEDERTRKLNAGRRAPSLPTGELAIRAPIPGLVVKVLVADGDQVEEDRPILILEAMKMENEIRSPREGRIRKVEVRPGQRVEQNSVLVVLE